MSPIVTIPSKISGVTYDDPETGQNRQDIIRKFLKPDTPLYLQPEPDNPASSDAIAIWFERRRMVFGKQRHHLGYLNQVQAKRVGAKTA